MDAESKTAHQESEVIHNEDGPPKASPNLEANVSKKDSPKHNSRQKKGRARSRSKTPQNMTEDSKILHVTLKKFDTQLNGQEVHEETENTEGNVNDKAKIDEKSEEKPVKDDISKIEEESNKNKQSPKQKEEKAKKEVTKKLKSPEKKEVTKKSEGSKKETPKRDKKDKHKSEIHKTNEPDTEPVEMDPLVISDEPDPELQFDENSDVESGKGSPVISRCVTRRSQTRNIPTPKTPKSADQDIDSDKNSAADTPTTDVVENDVELPKSDNLNDSCEYMDTMNLSTRVEVGSDATRVDYMEHHTSNLEDSNYIIASREKSLSETLRGLSARKPIRPNDDYRTRLLRSNQEKSDLNMPYTSRSIVEQITTGIKRKNRSITPEERKKFKPDSPPSLFSSPFANIRNKFKSDLPSSTPKLLSYRDNTSQMHYNEDDNFENGDDEKKSWCSIM